MQGVLMQWYIKHMDINFVKLISIAYMWLPVQYPIPISVRLYAYTYTTPI